MNLRKKNNHGQSGFTLLETLITIIILLMVTSIVVAGIPAAQRAYIKVTRLANAQVALSTTISVLQDELGTARNIVIDKDDKNELFIEYYSSRTNNKSRIKKDADDDNMILLEDFVDYKEATDSDRNLRPVISKSMLGEDLIVTYGTVTYDEDDKENHFVTFTNLAVYPKGVTQSDETKVVKLDKLNISVISPS